MKPAIPIVAGLASLLLGSAYAQAVHVTCLSNNGGFTVDGGPLIILQQGQFGTYPVDPSGGDLALWSCVTGDPASCNWLHYFAVPDSSWEIYETGNGYEIAMRAIEVDDALAPRWQPVDNITGPRRSSMGMAYDDDRQVTVMFGGRDETVHADTWEFDGLNWTQVATANSPPARFWHSIVYDSNRDRVVLFGGGNRDLGIIYDDTWEYDGTDWYEVGTTNSPGPLDQMSMVFNSHTNKVVLFGGQNFIGEQNSTWEYDGTDWSQVFTASSPPRGTLAAMAYDSVRKRVVLFGSGVVFDPNPSDAATWEYDGSGWTEVITDTSPPGRWAHAMAYDDENQRTVLFGGYGVSYPSGGQTSDTWVYDGIDWTQLSIENPPPAREQHGMTYDAARNRVIVHGGWSYWENDTWELIDEPSVQERIDYALNLISYSVDEGTLEGSGPGGSADGRLGALINMIENAGDLADDGQAALACEQLLDAANRTDGLSPPFDFVTGSAAEELFNLIQEIRDSLGC